MFNEDTGICLVSDPNAYGSGAKIILKYIYPKSDPNCVRNRKKSGQCPIMTPPYHQKGLNSTQHVKLIMRSGWHCMNTLSIPVKHQKNSSVLQYSPPESLRSVLLVLLEEIRPRCTMFTQKKSDHLLRSFEITECDKVWPTQFRWTQIGEIAVLLLRVWQELAWMLNVGRWTFYLVSIAGRGGLNNLDGPGLLRVNLNTFLLLQTFLILQHGSRSSCYSNKPWNNRRNFFCRQQTLFKLISRDTFRPQPCYLAG